jgi:DNA-binding XRE family transcriptional regulator
MIRSKREYETSIMKLKQNDDAIAKQKSQLENMNLSEADRDLILSPMLNFRNQLKKEIEAYERIKNQDWNFILSLANFHNIGRFLIALRIAFGLTQKELANLLGVTEAQISKDERNEYHGISYEKAGRIMEIFGVQPRPPKVNTSLKREDLLAANH